MDKLCDFLISRLILDFDGDVTYDTINNFLADDDSTTARALRGRLIAEGNAGDFLIVLSDCLREYIRTGITPDNVKSQIELYAES